MRGTLVVLMSVQGVAQAPLDFPALLAKAKSDPGQLRAEADLASLRRELAATGGILSEGPTLSVEGGRRTTPEGTTSDKAAALDAPLLLAPGLKRRASESLEASAKSTLTLIRAEARQRLRLAYLEAWLAQAHLALRQAQMEVTESWLKVAQARVASGSDPAFQADLLRGDQYRQRAELGEAHRQAFEAWARLRSLAELPAEPQALADPGRPELPDPAKLPRAFEQGLLRRALMERLNRESTQFELQQALRGARWSLRGSYASEGEERIARLGVALRLPRAGETGALRHEAASGRRALEREREQSVFQLESRFQTALTRLKSFGDVPEPLTFEGALRAVDLRLKEGKERPSDALLLRRQLLEAQSASLQRLQDAHALLAELELLILGDAS